MPRGKRPGLRARSKNARVSKKRGKLPGPKPGLKHLAIRTPAEEFHNIDDLVKIRNLEYELRTADDALAAAARKLEKCRKVMEVNDPVNACDIFGPPYVEPDPDNGKTFVTEKAETPKAEAPQDAASIAPSAGSA